MDAEPPRILDAGFGREIRQPLERLQKLRATIGIPAIIDAIGADKDIECPHRFREGECKAKKDGVSQLST